MHQAALCWCISMCLGGGWVLVAALGWVSQGRACMVGRGGSVVPRDVFLARCHHFCAQDKIASNSRSLGVPSQAALGEDGV